MTNSIYIFFALLFFNSGICQLNNLTASPYSLFGLGKINEYNIGITNSLGRAGIALSGESELNGLNPSSLATTPLNKFFFDFGLKSEYNSFGNSNSSSKIPSFGFSNISIGLPLDSISGISISLMPYSEVGYLFAGVVNNIGGSTETYQSTINGSGGINAVSVNYGRKMNKKLNLGISTHYLFGTIKQMEMVQLEFDYLTLEDKSYYSGFDIGAGMQYQLNPHLSVASVLKIESRLNGTKDRQVKKIVDQTPEDIEQQKNLRLKSYKMPTEITIGIKYNFRTFNFVSDYKRSFYNSLNQSDAIGRYTDANMLGFGIEKRSASDRRAERDFRFRVGYNYDDGNLRVNGKKIATSAITAGLGISLDNRKQSYLNISYAYSSRGVVSNILVKEYYHTISLNFDFSDIWFVKRRYD
ncbi:MAG: hypothetical protein CFE23_08355 [Flavobacterium sp. BFFFF1]|uniref:hypothetical protein n=1 Tax=Flavobacterium sp. BFFFF1 TaxID=2015557 RepID=UPI000BCA69E5|nr:hypothetical protein [Flavobacterium sp. BFFFF1]OYU80721.1 MAG: hypothetical protein CFE23_08355 [Flavobacterium sp. BFFFF1]